MISKKDWEVAYQRMVEEGRSRLGSPPTFDEVEALTRGELSDEGAERVREILSFYPEMLAVLTEPLPIGATGVLTKSELAADLAKIRAQTFLSEPLPFPEKTRPTRWLAIAAGIAIALTLGMIAIRSWTTTEPRALMTQVLYPEEPRRGPTSSTAVRLSKSADYMLQPVYSSERSYREYRLELLDLRVTPPAPVWERRDVARQPDGTYPIRLSTEALEPGLYRLVLYGVNVRAERLAEYTLRVSTK